jgi:glycosyltransferase involved in cell wall biosynthesis
MPSHSKKTLILIASDYDSVGNGRQIEMAVVAILAAGYRVRVVLVSSGRGLAVRLKRLGAVVYSVSRRPAVYLSVIFEVAAIIRNEQPQVVIGWSIETAFMVGSLRLLSRRSRHSWRYIQQLSHPPRTMTEATMVARADQVIVAGEWILEASKSIRPLESAFVVPPAAVAFDELMDRDQVAVQIGLNSKKIWTLCVAPMISTSRIDRLIWGFDQMAVVKNDVEHIVVGSGPLFQRLQRRAWVEEVDDSIHWFQNQPLLPFLFRHVDLVLQPGRVAYGGCFLESFAHGIPSVAIDTPQSHDMLGDSEAGILVPELPESEFARRAIEILENKKLQTHLGDAGRQRAVKQFNKTVSASKLLESLGL